MVKRACPGNLPPAAGGTGAGAKIARAPPALGQPQNESEVHRKDRHMLTVASCDLSLFTYDFVCCFKFSLPSHPLTGRREAVKGLALVTFPRLLAGRARAAERPRSACAWATSDESEVADKDPHMLYIYT